MSKRTRQYIGIPAALAAYYLVHEGAHLLCRQKAKNAGKIALPAFFIGNLLTDPCSRTCRRRFRFRAALRRLWRRSARSFQTRSLPHDRPASRE